MKKLIYIAFFLICTIQLSFAQGLKAGVLVGGNLFQQTKYTEPIYIPPNTYYTFLEENNGEGLINQSTVLNSINTGAIFSVFYKKLSLSVEPQYMYKRYNLYFSKPESIDWTVIEKGFRMPIYLSYRLTKNANSIELLTGITINKTNTVDFQSPGFGYFFTGDPIYYEGINYGRDVFNGVLYHNKTYLMLMGGIIQPLNKWNMSLRFQTYLNTDNNSIEANYFQIEISLNRYLFNSKDIIQKHFLYVE